MKNNVKKNFKNLSDSANNFHNSKKAVKTFEKESKVAFVELKKSVVELLQQKADSRTKLIFLSPRGGGIHPGHGKTLIEKIFNLSFDIDNFKFIKRSVRISEDELNTETPKRPYRTDDFKKVCSTEFVGMKEFTSKSRGLSKIIPGLKVKFSRQMMTHEKNPVPMFDVSFIF